MIKKPKRPNGSFFIYRSKNWSSFKLKHPEEKLTTLTTIMSESWTELSVEEKQIYNDQYIINVEQYQLQNIKYYKYLLEREHTTQQHTYLNTVLNIKYLSQICLEYLCTCVKCNPNSEKNLQLTKEYSKDAVKLKIFQDFIK